MPVAHVTLRIKVPYREETHLDAVVNTVRESAELIMANIGMLLPANNRIAPQITMAVTGTSVDDQEIDIGNQMATKYGDDTEDPFA